MQTQRWGDYEIYEVLGKGGMGIVYRGRQVSLDRPVAIKVLPVSYTRRPDFIQRFYREAKAVAQINCPQIVQIYGAGEYQGRHYFAMEYIEGEDLAEKIKRGEVFDIGKVLYIVKETARGLAAAAEKNIIHRDIKPGNIMITNKGGVKIMDFGLAKFITEGTELTQAGVVMGTVNYLSPEQGQGKKVDQRTDIYSLGVVMYELLTGEVPFKGENPSSVIYQHIHTPPPLPSRKKNTIPRSVEAIVMKCLQKDPDDRYFSARELIRDIEAVERGETPRTAVMRKTAGGGKALRTAVLVFLLLLAAGGAAFLASTGEWRRVLDRVRRGVAAATGRAGAKAGEEEKRRKRLETLVLRLKEIEEELQTQDIAVLDRLKGELARLAAEFPGRTDVAALAERVGKKIGRLKERRKKIEKVEEYLGAKDFEAAENLAAALYRENPDDLILENLFKRVQREKEAYLKEKEKEEKIRRELAAAEQLLRMGSFALAKKKFEDVLLMDPGNVRAQKGLAAATAKLAEEEKKKKEPEKPALTAAEQIAITECINYYNEAEKFYRSKDYDNALLYIDKALNVEGIDHIPAAVEKKKQAVALKTRISAELSAARREKMRRERIARLRASAAEKEKEGKELEAIADLKALAALDTDREVDYRARIALLARRHDKKTSTACVKNFAALFSKGDVAGMLSLLKGKTPRFKGLREEIGSFMRTFSGVRSAFLVEKVNLAEDGKRCIVSGAWKLSFAYNDGVRTIPCRVEYPAEVVLVKAGDGWRISDFRVTGRKVDS